MTFDFRNGKTLNRKTISFDGTLLAESNLKPLFGLYDKYRGSLGFKMETAENKQVKIDLSTISNDVKLALTNKRALFILVEETIVAYPLKDNTGTPKTKLRYYFHRVYSDKEIKEFENSPAYKRTGKGLSNLIQNQHTSLDDNRFPTYYIIDGFYQNGASNGMPAGKSLRDYINKPRYEENIVVKDIIFSEI
jgi:hypothetical protein